MRKRNVKNAILKTIAFVSATAMLSTSFSTISFAKEAPDDTEIVDSAYSKVVESDLTEDIALEEIEEVAAAVVENTEAGDFDEENAEAEKAEVDGLENPKGIDFDAEVKKIIETAEPSKEVKEQVEEFENGKDEFNKKLEKNPQEAEKIIEEELKRVDELKKKAETIKANIERETKRTFKNSDFTNWWNGSSGLY